MSTAEVQALKARQAAARKALVDLGYLIEGRFTLSNKSANVVIQPLITTARGVIPQEHFYFTGVLLAESNTIVLAVPPEDVPKWEKLIREADMP